MLRRMRSQDVQSIPAPRNPRLPIRVRVKLSGRDDEGRPFVEETHTIEVAGRGARIATTHQLPLGAEVSITNLASARSAVAKVLWRSEKLSPDGPTEFGAILLASFQPEDVWGEANTPVDGGLASGGSVGQTSNLIVMPGGTTAVPPVDPGQLTVTVPIPAAQPLVERERQPSAQSELQHGPEASRGLAHTLDKLKQAEQVINEASEAAVHSVRLAGEGMIAELLSAQASSESEVQSRTRSHRKRAAELSLGATDPERPQETPARHLCDQLQPSVAALHQKGAEDAGEEFRKMAGELVQLSMAELRRQAEDTVARLGEEICASKAELVEEGQRQLAGFTWASIETFRNQLQDTLAIAEQKTTRDVAEKIREVGKEMLDENTAALRKQTDEMVETFAEKLKAVTAQVIEEHRRQLDALRQASLESLARDSEAAVHDQYGRLRLKAEQLVDKRSRQLEARTRALLDVGHSAMASEAGEASGSRLERPRAWLVDLGERLEPLAGSLRRVPWWVAPSFIVLVLLLSIRPVYHLKHVPPAGFYDEAAQAMGGRQRTMGQQLARAYWACAEREVQDYYDPEMELPADPPPQFRVNPVDLADSGYQTDEDVRLFYWGKLRLVWISPAAWNKSYRLRLGWLIGRGGFQPRRHG